MKAKFLFLLLVISSVCFADQVISYKIEGKLTGTLEGKYAYLQIFSNSVQDSKFIQASISGSSFIFSGQAKHLNGDFCRARLFISDKAGMTSKNVTEMMKTSNHDYITIVLEPRVMIEIGDNMRSAVVAGSQLNYVNSLFEEINTVYKQSGDSLEAWLTAEKKKNENDKKELERLEALAMQKRYHLQDIRYEAVLKVVSAHPYSPVSMTELKFVATANQYFSAKYQPLLESVWDKLPGEIKESKDGKAIEAILSRTGTLLKLKPGIAIPSFTFNDENGTAYNTKGYQGKYLFLDFWTSWCGPCRKEHYYMRKAFEKFRDKNFNILQVSLDDKKEQWLRLIKLESFPWTTVHHKKGWDKELEKLFDIKGVPTNYLIGPDGTIVARNLRGEALEKKLAELLQ
jgi:peroxiredoxin